MDDVLEQQQQQKQESAKLRTKSYLSDYGSSISFSSSVDSAARDSSPSRIDDSVLAKSKETNWQEEVKRSFGCFAELSFNQKNGDILKDSKDYKIIFKGLDARWVILIGFAIFVITYKMLIVAVPYANKENLFEATSYIQEKYLDLINWSNENEIREKITLLYPLLCGLFVSTFSVMMVYFDSNVPGVNPPSPFSPNSKHRFRQQKQSSLNLAYMTAIASGIIVSGMMMYHS